MSDTDEDIKRMRWEERHPEEQPDAIDPCREGHEDWALVQRTTYGEDADGRRGVPLLVYNCATCGDEKEVIG